jgi:hypothetical protein
MPSPTGSQDLDAPFGGGAGEDFAHDGTPRHRAPDWLQVTVIVALLGASFYVGLEGRYLWSSLLAVAGMTFGLAFILRRMIGDAYDRS